MGSPLDLCVIPAHSRCVRAAHSLIERFTTMPEDKREEGISVVRSPDLDAYAAGQIDASKIRCALCGHAPCACPEFGTDAYFELIDRVHGRKGSGQ